MPEIGLKMIELVIIEMLVQHMFTHLAEFQYIFANNGGLYHLDCYQ